MATPQWETLKSTIYALNAAERKAVAAKFGLTLPAEERRAVSALASEAYASAKRKAGQYGNSITAAYDAIALEIGVIKSKVREQSNVPPACEHGVPLGLPCGACEIARLQANRSAKLPDAKAKAAPELDVQGALDALAAQFEARMRNLGALDMNAVRAMVKAAVTEMPAQVIEVRNGAEVIGRVTGTKHKQFAELVTLAATRLPSGFHPNIWLAGPAGSGKTHAAEMLAAAFKREFHYNGALSMAHEVLGYNDANGRFIATPFHRAFTSASVYLFDECDACADNSPLLALSGALANGLAAFPSGMVKRNPDSLILAAANTWGLGATADYVGRAKIDAAFLDRFAIRLFWDYDAELERAICGNATAVDAVQSARAKAKAAGLKVLISPRASLAIAAMLKAGITLQRAKELTYLANLSAEQCRMIEG